MKFRLGDKLSFGILACGIIATYTGVYLLQTQVQNLYANQEYDYVISTIVNPAVVQATGTVSIMHFFSNQTDNTSHALTITSMLPNTVDIINTNIPIDSTQNSGSNKIYTFHSTSSEDVLVLDVRAQDGIYGLIKNTATISVANGDPYMGNNKYAASFVSLSDINSQADMYVASMTADTTNGTSAGDTVTFHFRVQNQGPDTAYGVTAEYTLDPSLIATSTTANPILQQANIIQREIAELQPGQYVDFYVDAEILTTVFDQQKLTNTVHIFSPITDPDTANNDKGVSMTVSSQAREVTLSMLADNTQLCLGQSSHVLIGYTNTDTQGQYLTMQLNKSNGLTMHNFAPAPTTQSLSTYDRQIGSINAGVNGFIGFDITANTVGTKSITAQAFDDKTQVWDTKNILFTVNDCTAQNPDDNGTGTDTDQETTTDGKNIVHVRRFTKKKVATGTTAEDPVSHFAASAKNIDASAYRCADSDEIASAYTYAYENQLTTMKTIQGFRPCDKILRIELAKILANYAVNILGKKPDDSRICVFDDMKNESAENKLYAELVCKLGIMGLRSNGKPDTIFNPYDTVTRAQLGTSLSRQIYGSKYNTDNEKYWFLDHLLALRRDDVIRYIDNPTMEELRSFVAIMLMRIDLLHMVPQTATK